MHRFVVIPQKELLERELASAIDAISKLPQHTHSETTQVKSQLPRSRGYVHSQSAAF
jgi:hypothetical protein